MKLPARNYNTYKVSVLASILLLYLLITGQYHVVQYVVFTIIVVERAFIAFALWLVGRMQKEMAKKMMEVIQQAQATGQSIQRPFDQEL